MGLLPDGQRLFDSDFSFVSMKLQKNAINLHHHISDYYNDVIIRFSWSCRQVYCVQGKGSSKVRFKREEHITGKKDTMLSQKMKRYFNFFAVILFIAF